MGKDKKKKKDLKDIESLKNEYEQSLALLKAKRDQFDGMLAELKIYLKEVKSMREQLRGLLYRNEKIEEEISLDYGRDDE